MSEIILTQIKKELSRLDVGTRNMWVDGGVKAAADGNLEAFIEETFEQIQDNEQRVVRGSSFTLVFLIKKYKANGKSN